MLLSSIIIAQAWFGLWLVAGVKAIAIPGSDGAVPPVLAARLDGETVIDHSFRSSRPSSASRQPLPVRQLSRRTRPSVSFHNIEHTVYNAYIEEATGYAIRGRDLRLINDHAVDRLHYENAPIGGYDFFDSLESPGDTLTGPYEAIPAGVSGLRIQTVGGWRLRKREMVNLAHYLKLFVFEYTLDAGGASALDIAYPALRGTLMTRSKEEVARFSLGVGPESACNSPQDVSAPLACLSMHD